MKRRTMLGVLVLQMVLAGAAHAMPSYATYNGNSCHEGCHTDVRDDRMAAVDADTVLDLGTQLDGSTRGPLETFVATPGSTVTMSVQVLDGMEVFAVQLKRLEKPGQLNDVNNLLVWTEDNGAGNTWTRQEDGNPPYFTKDDGSNGGLPPEQAGVFRFDLSIDLTTPPDVYDLEFAVAGRRDDVGWYQDEHFYVQVPEVDSQPKARSC